MDAIDVKRGLLYKEISGLLQTDFTREQIKTLSDKYGESDVLWMLRIVRDDIAQGKMFHDPEELVRKLLTKPA